MVNKKVCKFRRFFDFCLFLSSLIFVGVFFSIQNIQIYDFFSFSVFQRVLIICALTAFVLFNLFVAALVVFPDLFCSTPLFPFVFCLCVLILMRQLFVQKYFHFVCFFCFLSVCCVRRFVEMFLSINLCKFLVCSILTFWGSIIVLYFLQFYLPNLWSSLLSFFLHS